MSSQSPDFIYIDAPWAGHPGRLRKRLVNVSRIIHVEETVEGGCCIYMTDGLLLEPMQSFNVVTSEITGLDLDDPDDPELDRPFRVHGDA